MLQSLTQTLCLRFVCSPAFACTYSSLARSLHGIAFVLRFAWQRPRLAPTHPHMPPTLAEEKGFNPKHLKSLTLTLTRKTLTLASSHPLTRACPPCPGSHLLTRTRLCLSVCFPQDVAWHCHHAGIFGSVGDDKQLILWDVRRPSTEGATGTHHHSDPFVSHHILSWQVWFLWRRLAVDVDGSVP